MKKTLFLVALVAILVFAFAASAFAAKDSSVEYIGNDGNYIYIEWSSLAGWGDNPPASSPHGNYATATAKCQVCHAVHQASPAGDTLLKMAADEACFTCHVDNDLTGKVVYGGDADIAAALGDDHHTTGGNCGLCHASVHGGNAIQDVASLAGGMLLETFGPRDMNPLSVWDAIDGHSDAEVVTGYTRNEIETSATIRPATFGLFCTGCHDGSYWSVSGGSASTNGLVVGHRVMAEATDAYVPPAGSTASYTGKIAWAAVDECTSCHDGDNGFGATGFPHFTPYQSRFMKQADYAGGTYTNYVGYSADVDSGVLAFGAFEDVSYWSDEDGPGAGSHLYASVQDGTCIKCHRGAGSTGVGFGY